MGKLHIQYDIDKENMDKITFIGTKSEEKRTIVVKFQKSMEMKEMC